MDINDMLRGIGSIHDSVANLLVDLLAQRGLHIDDFKKMIELSSPKKEETFLCKMPDDIQLLFIIEKGCAAAFIVASTEYEVNKNKLLKMLSSSNFSKKDIDARTSYLEELVLQLGDAAVFSSIAKSHVDLFVHTHINLAFKGYIVRNNYEIYYYDKK